MKRNIINSLMSALRYILGRAFVYASVVVFETSTETSLAHRRWLARALFGSATKARIRIRRAGINDIQKLERFDDFAGRNATRALARFRDGHLCFVAEENGNILSYLWIAFRELWVDAIERKVQISPCSAYAYNEYTDPDYRGMGILPAVLITALNYLSRNGISEKIAVVYSHNLSAIRAHQKVGSRKMGTITEIRLFGSRRYICNGETQDDGRRLREMFSI